MTPEIREAVKKRLAELGYSQTDVAKIVNLDRRYINRMLNQEVGEVPESWRKLAHALGIELTAEWDWHIVRIKEVRDKGIAFEGKETQGWRLRASNAADIFDNPKEGEVWAVKTERPGPDPFGRIVKAVRLEGTAEKGE